MILPQQGVQTTNPPNTSGGGNVLVTTGPSGKQKCWIGDTQITCPPGTTSPSQPTLPQSPAIPPNLPVDPGTGLPNSGFVPPPSLDPNNPAPSLSTTTSTPTGTIFGLSTSTLLLIGGAVVLLMVLKK